MNDNGKDLTSAVLGNRIRQARKDAGLSQVRLAQLLNTTQSAISLYEAGQRAVGIDMLMNVARILNRPLHYFLSAIDVVLYVRDSRIANLVNELERRPQDIEELLEYWEFIRWRNAQEQEQAMELVGGS
ncbi:MAG: helix-turn-helix transcriptional regulator [Dehalococcoidia bacterium]|nr:helix-turn-helix transcriptional regulator [Dehalococcoidia bacterium]MYD29531.1 helix-turn-helix transcriptional regulator [Dehalococcoidia bacterium]